MDPLASPVCHSAAKRDLASSARSRSTRDSSFHCLGSANVTGSQLHAHLTGSISRRCLHDIWLSKREADPALELQDPLDAIPPGGIASSHDIKT
jgi:hypothetical protein